VAAVLQDRDVAPRWSTRERDAMSARTESVDSFLGAVAAQLPGPSGHRAAILDELNDGLLVAIESHERAGRAHAQAVNRALEEFGSPGSVAASFRSELMIARGRRTALAVHTATPIVTALWIAAARSRDATPTNHLFDSPADHIAAALLIAGLIASGVGTLVITRRLTGWLALPPRVALVGAMALALITIATDLAAVTVL
jgi:hypothetical protein